MERRLEGWCSADFGWTSVIIFEGGIEEANAREQDYL